MIKKAIILLILLALLGCESTNNPDSSASEDSQFVEYGVAGHIVKITASEDDEIMGTIKIDGQENNGAKYKEAVVTVTSDTKIYINDLTDFDNLEVGMYINVFFEGPVKESHPVQATAKQINIIPDDAK